MNTFIYDPVISVQIEPHGTKVDTDGAVEVLKAIRDIAHTTDNAVRFVADSGVYFISKHSRDQDLRAIAAEVATVFTDRRKNINPVDLSTPE